GYMKKDDSPYRYFAFLNLFVFFMLLIVYSGNFLLMFVGWEGVGLCSYLLISYESWRKEAKDAGTKAFLITRFADFGFILFLLIYYKIFNTFEISALLEEPSNPLIPLLLISGILAACGKSAQFPFYVWLPDAMEGPTPVSALIHAATMVTAGVFLLIKIFPLLSLYPQILNIIIFLSTLTFLLSGIIAIFERDLKRILAYSTISQIGYMFFAIGISYPLLAFLHLLTHAFFKALLFLSSGNVMHIIHKKIDIFETRGMRKIHPFTSYTFLLGSLALSGFPLTGGFISKELIINASFKNLFLFYLASIGAFLTSFYIMRGYVLCFEGELKINPQEKIEGVMNLSLLVLSIFVILTGLNIFEEFYFKNFGEEITFYNPILYQFFPLFLSITGIYLALKVYLKKPIQFNERISKILNFYDFFISKIVYGIINFLSKFFSTKFDRGLIDLLIVEGIGKLTILLGRLIFKLFKRKPSFYITLLILVFLLIIIFSI
ncbi:MAG: NADH-quinone oxidoreductase subunit L, partial [candidate division WOR-3 bacterium]